MRTESSADQGPHRERPLDSARPHADPSQYNTIWDHVLSQVGHVKYNAFIISPYYNYYVIRAMAEMGHRKAALSTGSASTGAACSTKAQPAINCKFLEAPLALARITSYAGAEPWNSGTWTARAASPKS